MSNCPKKSYTIFHFALDLFLIFLTGGLWFIWIILKFLRKNV